MRLNLDVGTLRSSMALWRDTLVICEAAADRSHASRAGQVKMLKDLSGALAGWLDLLRMCSVEPADQAALAGIISEIRECRGWADECLAAMHLMQGVEKLA